MGFIMKSIATFLFAVLLAGLVTAKLLNYPKLFNYPLEEPSQWMSTKKVKEKLDNYKCFKQSMNETLTGLENGECNMQDAQALVCAAARRYNPVYLKALHKKESGTTDEQRVANNLVSHLRTIIEVRPDIALRIRALEIELMQPKNQGGR
jgi:hypothetical protein